MKNREVVILNITHGEHPCMNQPPFLPIAAGACRSDIINDACGDDNISAKNKWYGDFTSLYWAWKNLKNVDIIGASHYRRYLADDNFLNSWKDTYSVSWLSFANRKYNINAMVQLLQECDFVMLKSIEFDRSVYQQYLQWHPYPENIEYATEALRKIHPEAVDIWLQLLQERTLQPGYLFLTNWEHFDELCSWLYPVLLEIESKVELAKYDGCQSRVIGFLYERLVPVFIKSRQYKVIQRSLYMVEHTSKISVMGYKLRYLKHLFIKTFWGDVSNKYGKNA